MSKKIISLSKCLLFFFALGSGFFVRSPALAQNIVETDLGAQPASILVQNLLGIGVSFSNVTYQGTGGSSGTFTGGNGIIGFDSGIILSNGASTSVVGPHGTGTSTCNALPGDSDLAALAGVAVASTHDATVLSFDFIPQFSTISFQYVFSSDEYNDYIGSFDDVFGFFVNGTNTALIPGTSTVVSINTVNNCQNASYFIDNSNGQSSGACTITKPSANLNTTMNGLTTVLTVNAAVMQGVSNHIKLAICDLGDCNLDSNVFIRASSFTSGQTATDTPTNSPTPTPTDTFTPCLAGGNTCTPTFTFTETPTLTPTITPTNSPTNTPTKTPSPTITLTFTPTFTPTCQTLVWPNPFNPSYAVGNVLKIGCVPGGATVTFYTLSGEKVVVLSPGGRVYDMDRTALWDGRNQNGVPVAPGVYYYVIQVGDRVFNRGKILLIISEKK